MPFSFKYSFIGLLALCGFGFHLNATATTYTFGVVPQFEFSKLQAIWQPILQQVTQQTGVTFDLHIESSIPQFEKALQTGQYHFAYMNPYHLLVAHRTQHYQPVLRDHSRQLQGILVVNKKSGITQLKQLNGKTIAFPAPNALGASLQMRAELTEKAGITFTPIYVKTHDSVYLNVLFNQAAAGGGVQKTLSNQSQQIQDALTVLYKTTPVPPHPIAVHPAVPEDIQQQVIQALLQLSQQPESAALLQDIPIKQLGTATFDDYVPLQDMHLEQYAQ